MKPPKLTSLQMLILALLIEGPKRTFQICRVLRQRGIPRTSRNVCRLLHRLQRVGSVRAEPVMVKRGPHRFAEYRYRLTAAGLSAWRERWAFYAAMPWPERALEDVISVTEGEMYAYGRRTQKFFQEQETDEALAPLRRIFREYARRRSGRLWD